MQLDPYSFHEEALIDALQVDKGTDLADLVEIEFTNYLQSKTG
jgi:hypothetical protein